MCTFFGCTWANVRSWTWVSTSNFVTKPIVWSVKVPATMATFSLKCICVVNGTNETNVVALKLAIWGIINYTLFSIVTYDAHACEFDPRDVFASLMFTMYLNAAIHLSHILIHKLLLPWWFNKVWPRVLGCWDFKLWKVQVFHKIHKTKSS